MLQMLDVGYWITLSFLKDSKRLVDVVDVGCQVSYNIQHLDVKYLVPHYIKFFERVKDTRRCCRC